MVQAISNAPASLHNSNRPTTVSGQPRVKEDPGRTQAQEVAPEVITAAAEVGNQLAKAYGIDIKFEIDEKTDIRVMRIVDADSGTLIKEMPPKAIVAMIGKLWETMGLFIDAKA